MNCKNKQKLSIGTQPVFLLACHLLILATTLLLCCCNHGGDYTPKPRGYARIDLPQRDYAPFDTAALPFAFEKSSVAMADLKKDEQRLKWVDLRYPDLGGIIFLSYIPLRKATDLAGEVDTSYRLLSKHFDFSSGVDERAFVNPEHRVYATTYKLQGQNVASTYQFWATDSVSHFLRGSLYIDCVPNNDSLAPVLEYLQQDLDHLIETLTWK